MDRRLGVLALVLVTALAGCGFASGPDRSYDHQVRADNADDRPRNGTVRVIDDVTGEIVFETTVTVRPNESRPVFDFRSVAGTEAGRFEVRVDPDVGESSTATVPMTDCLGDIRVQFEPDGADLFYSTC